MKADDMVSKTGSSVTFDTMGSLPDTNERPTENAQQFEDSMIEIETVEKEKKKPTLQ